MKPKEYFLIDPQRCHYCSRCISHTRQQHEDHLARWCDVHHRWCGHQTSKKVVRTNHKMASVR